MKKIHFQNEVNEIRVNHMTKYLFLLCNFMMNVYS